MWKKTVITALLSGAAGLAAFGPHGSLTSSDGGSILVQEGFDPVVVLELFTSQGCSSCPPADALLKRVREQGVNPGGGLYTVAYHVDYWNYIGWEDPFSKKEYTRKQQAYNTKFGTNSNYTPELVINGREHFVGSDASRLSAEISEYKKIRVPNAVAITAVHRQGGRISFTYDISGETAGKKVRAVLVLDEITTKVARGENRGRTLTNTDIAVAEKTVEATRGQALMTMDIPASVAPGNLLHILLLVEDEQHAISAAAGQRIPG